MAPTPIKATSKSPSRGTRYCGLGNHRLQRPHKTIDDTDLLNFARKLNEELRASTLICGNCLNVLRRVYKSKVKNAIHHHRMRQVSKGTISDVSSSQKPDTTTSESSQSQSQSLTLARRENDLNRALSNVNIRKRRANDEDPSNSTNHISTPSTNLELPTTSAAAAALAALRAAAKRQRTQSKPPPEPHHSTQSSNSTIYDDDEPLLSLNAVNGTRLPHIQPIPKRRQIHLTGPQQDIYLAGTTGG